MGTETINPNETRRKPQDNVRHKLYLKSKKIHKIINNPLYRIKIG